MIEQDTPVGADRLSDDVIGWLMRCYDSQELWKRRARDVFMNSNGDSVLSRTRVASTVRKYFLDTPPPPEDVKRWKENYEDTESVHVEPPKVSASNAGYVDWLYVADYLLLGCAGITDEYNEENQRRETEFQQVLSSYQLRLAVHDARNLVREQPQLTDDSILDLLRKTHEKASLANMKEARRLERASALHSKPIAPERPDPLRRYNSVFFPSVLEAHRKMSEA